MSYPLHRTTRHASARTAPARPLAPVAILLLLALVLAGCETKPGVIFPPMADAPHWPGAPEPTRITWVGQLQYDQDLKPGVNGFEAVGQAVFGKKPVRAM